jgi:hypothetical protein
MFFNSEKKISLFLLFSFIVAVSGFYVLQNNRIFTTSAESDDNIAGYAWSENMGWISFNCTNESECGSSNYGVDINMETGDFSGYAWSSNIGWIDLSPAGPYPGVPEHGARYEYSDSGDERRVTGWAKVLALGDEGWIKLHTDPWLSGWSKRMELTIDSSDITGDLDQFPVPVFINTSAGKNNADVSAIFDEVGTSSQKIAITGADATTQLYAEIEEWDATAEEAVIWVGGYDMDISASSDTRLYLYYDATQEDNTSYVSTTPTATTSDRIWGNGYALVHNLNEESGDAIDSSPGENDGTVYGGATQGADGMVDGAYEFDGTDDYVYFGNVDDLVDSSAGAISLWFNHYVSEQQFLMGWSQTDNTADYMRLESRPGSYIRWITEVDDVSNGVDSDSPPEANEWINVVVTQDGVASRMYVNGELQADTGDNTWFATHPNLKLYLADELSWGGYYFNGKIDNFHIYDRIVSEAWIKASYEAGRDNLVSWGAEETVNYGVTADINTGDFSGWAWNKSQADNVTGVGWISFNCADSGAGGCDSTDYKVTGHLNTIPAVVNMTAPNWSASEACSNTALRSILRWEFDDPDQGSSQSAYRLVVDTDGTRDDDEPLLDTGKVDGNAKQYLLGETYLDYDTSYYWWVKAWDNHDVDSAWNQYSTDPDTDNDDNSVNTFTTYKHEFPEVDFYWVPDPISLNEDVTFTSDSLIYTTADPTTATSCSTSTCSYNWDFSGSDVTIEEGTTASSSIVVQFTSTSTQSIILEVTDQDNYTCASSTSIEMNPELPTWREVKVEE